MILVAIELTLFIVGRVENNFHLDAAGFVLGFVFVMPALLKGWELDKLKAEAYQALKSYTVPHQQAPFIILQLKENGEDVLEDILLRRRQAQDTQQHIERFEQLKKQYVQSQSSSLNVLSALNQGQQNQTAIQDISKKIDDFDRKYKKEIDDILGDWEVWIQDE